MVLTIDIGNTNIVVGCLESAQKVAFVERISTAPKKTETEYAVQLKALLELVDFPVENLQGAIISSVVPQLTNLIKKAIFRITGLEPLVVGPGIKNGLHIQIDNPAQLGTDLVVNAVAGITDYTSPLMIVDMGTATTVSVIDEKQAYIGGMILPGIEASLSALVSCTSQLPHISLEVPKRMIGKNTIECMKSGVIYGNAASIDGLIDRVEAALSQQVTVILTGGIAHVIAPYCRHAVTVDEILLLKGLYYIYQKNHDSIS